MKKIAVIRGLDVRFTQAEFAATFTKLQPVFVGNLDKEITSYLTKKEVEYINLPLKPPFLVDPVKFLFGRADHRSWLNFDQKKIEKVIKEADVVEIYESYFFYASQVAKLAKKYKKPLITEIWTSFANHPASFIPPYSFNVKKVVEATDLFILRSKKATSFLNPFKIPRKKMKIIYHGVNLERFYSLKRKEDGKVRILFSGVLSSHKGLDDALSVFEKLNQKYPNIELLVCGRGPLKPEVEEMSKKLAIRYFGHVDHLEIPKIYRMADIFCGPSKEYSFFGIKRWEEFVGYTFMEALASGLPIVATNCGGIPEIIGKSNIIINQGDRNGLCTALEGLIIDSVKRQEIGLKNRKRAEKMFDLFKQVSQTEKLILKQFF